MSQGFAKKLVGQQEMAESAPVVIAADQMTINERLARRAAEMQSIAAADAERLAASTRRERVSLSDRRGSAFRGSQR